MKISNVADNISNFLLEPHKETSKARKGIAWATTIIAGVVTLGTAQIASAIWKSARTINLNQVQQKISNLFRQLYLDSSAAPPKVSESENEHAHEDPAIEKAAKEVYWMVGSIEREIIEAASPGESVEDLQKKFIKGLEQEFQNRGLSLSDLNNNKNARNIFFNSAYLKPVILRYAYENKLKNILDDHIFSLSTDIMKKEKSLINKVTNGLKLPSFAFDEKCFFYLTNEIEKQFNAEGRSLREVLKDEASFTHMGSLPMIGVLMYYETYGTRPPPGKDWRPAEGYNFNPSPKQSYRARPSAARPPEEKKSVPLGELDPHKLQRQDAARLGRKLGGRRGLVSQLNLRELMDNEAKLMAAVKKIVRQEHPDRNAAPDHERKHAALELYGLLKDGTFHIYLQALNEYRENRP